ncbi:MAG: hypothetical protein L0196_07160 [candidate division Zixibacteria bacterium]|nr:hypothetical protein [candidate division Zixibacteria bacterium]
MRPRFDVELDTSLKPEGSGLQYRATALLRPLAVLSVIFLAITLAGNNWERLKSAPFFIALGTVSSVCFLLLLWALCFLWWFFIGSGQVLELVKDLLPAGGEEFRICLAFLVLAIPMLRIVNRTLKRARVSHRAAVTGVVLLFLLDAYLYLNGGKAAALAIARAVATFFRAL